MRRPLTGFVPAALEHARDAAGLSRGELAIIVGVDGTTIHNWETKRAHPAPNHLAAAAAALGVPLSTLIVIPEQERTIADLRTLAGLTQQELGDRAGLSSTTLGRIERGETLTKTSAVALAHILDVDESEIRRAFARARDQVLQRRRS